MNTSGRSVGIRFTVLGLALAWAVSCALPGFDRVGASASGGVTGLAGAATGGGTSGGSGGVAGVGPLGGSGGGAGAGGAAGQAVPDHCTNQRTDGDESDIDCGGSCLPCSDRQ